MKRKILNAAICLMLLVIWGHSCMPQGSSSAESHWLTDQVLNPIFQTLFGLTLTNDFVRKAAHVVEFAFLSICMTLRWNGTVKKVGLAGFFAAFLDETVQIFSGRGSMILDVWIDMIGVALGFGIGWLILWMVHRRKKRTTEKAC